MRVHIHLSRWPLYEVRYVQSSDQSAQSIFPWPLERSEPVAAALEKFARRVCALPMPAAAEAAEPDAPEAASPQATRDRADLLTVFRLGPLEAELHFRRPCHLHTIILEFVVMSSECFFSFHAEQEPRHDSGKRSTCRLKIP